jgi:endonuclease/exonuclease/phosphatase family metal-dependent hydrolase
VKIMVAPQKVGVGLGINLATVKGHQPLVVGLTEMDLGHSSFVPMMTDTLGPAYTVVSDDVGVHSQEIPVAIRTGPFSAVTRSQVIPISPDVGTKGVGNDRYLAVVRLSYRGRTYVVMHTHTDAVIQNHRTLQMLDNERVDVTAAAMQTIEDRAAAVLADPTVTALWIMGDFNVLPVDDPAIEWVHSPQATFRRLGMQWRNSRVIYLAWSKGVHRRGDVQVIPPHTAENASDHGWLVGGFRRARSLP